MVSFHLQYILPEQQQIKGFIANSIYFHKCAHLDMICDLKSSVLKVLFRLCSFPHSFNKYLMRAHDEHSALFGGCYETKPFPVLRGLIGGGEREKWTLISHINESLIPNNDYKAEAQGPPSFNTR